MKHLKFTDIEEYTTLDKEFSKERIQTNPRYKSFKQVLFTAGDEEQFANQISKKNGKHKTRPELSNNWKNLNLTKKCIPHSLTTCSVLSTFRYLFHHLKKGIFVKIRDNKVEVFLPFSKYNFDSVIGESLLMTNVQVHKVYRIAQEGSNRTFNPARINRNVRQWVGNGFIIRNEYPLNEGDSNVCAIKHMFETLCKKRNIPNLEFFINRRDFPLLRKDGKHPYSELVRNGEQYVPQKPCPILSMCSHEDYFDQAIPTWNDWVRIAAQNFKIKFNSAYKNRENYTFPVFTSMDWLQKIDKFVFRGASTGHGVDAETNPRIKLAKIAQNNDRLDAGITNWNLRPRAFKKENGFVLDTIRDTSIPLVSNLNPEEQSQYRYIIHIPGHVCAFRLSLELAMGSVILLVDSPYKLWYHHLLKDGIHYISVKHDLSNLAEKMAWCDSNLDKCQEVAANALKFYSTYLTVNSVLDGLQKILWDIREQVGEYKYNKFPALKIIENREKRSIARLKPVLQIFEEGWVVLKKSRTTLVEVNKQLMLVRKSVVDSKTAEFNHEIFIGARVLPKKGQVAQFKGYHEGKSYWEYIPGPTLSEYLESEKVTCKDLKNIILQICGILQNLLETEKFTHNDLFPWNIILKPSDEILSYGNKHGLWRSEAIFSVFLVDFGKSHAVYRKIHHGRIRGFETNKCQDIITFIISVIAVLLSSHCEKNILTMLFDMIGFLQKEPEYCPDIRGVRELRNFVQRAKKYTEIIYSHKGRLENLEPGDFVDFMKFKIEDRRLRSLSDSNNRLILFENIFDEPENLLQIAKQLHSYQEDENTNTFRVIACLITKANLLAFPENKTYKQILDILV